jgi:hypothetical protein
MRDVCHGIVLRSLRSPRGGTFCFRTSNANFLQDINMKVSEASVMLSHHTGLRHPPVRTFQPHRWESATDERDL